ncbi:MAG: glycosyltransferase family 2 protein [Lachnospiraceae bacterium]|nr:glycosyltransferase family 2 protein [Lachnospiraceae bacterium]
MISVVIPVYNGETYIRQTIRSICRSTCRELEIIAVDDGSTDRSLAILQSLKQQDQRIAVYTQPNSGVVAARNFGAALANGDYLCFCDQDDLVAASLYEKLLARMERDGSDMAMCSSARLIDGKRSDYDLLEDNLYAGSRIRTGLIYPMLFNGYRVPFLQEAGNHYPNIWVCLFRTSFWKAAQLRFRAYVNFEDDLLVKLEALSKAQKVSTISDVGYLWRVNERSETYACRFVEDIGAKQDACLQDQEASLQAAGASSRELTYFRQVTRCKQYIDAMHNLVCGRQRASKAEIRTYCATQIYSRQFEDSINARRFLKKGRVIPGCILPLLSRRWSVTAYVAQTVLEHLLRTSLRSPLLTGIERRIKRMR